MSQVAQQTARDQTAIRPFQVNVPEAELTELRRRIKTTKWPERETVADASQGVQLATTQALEKASITYQHGSLKAQDLLGHGTHVVGIIGAVASSDSGVNGVADCEMKVWKVF